MRVGADEIGLQHQLRDLGGIDGRHTDRLHAVPDQRIDRGSGNEPAHFTMLSSFCVMPLRIVALSRSETPSALTCRAHSNVPMS